MSALAAVMLFSSSFAISVEKPDNDCADRTLTFMDSFPMDFPEDELTCMANDYYALCMGYTNTDLTPC